jgi:hypothetical protein
MAWWNPLSWGGSSANTDRKETFKGWSGLENLMPFIGKGAQNADMGLKFFQDIMSGDPNKIAQAIAPETKVIQGQAEQQKKQNAEFGTRSGGTAATNANIDTNKLSSIQNLVNTLRPKAAEALTSAGLQEAQIGGAAAGNLSSQAIKSRMDSFFINQETQKQYADFIAAMLGISSGGGSDGASSG